LQESTSASCPHAAKPSHHSCGPLRLRSLPDEFLPGRRIRPACDRARKRWRHEDRRPCGQLFHQLLFKGGETACSRRSASSCTSYHAMPKISDSMRSDSESTKERAHPYSTTRPLLKRLEALGHKVTL
jgi:hypothetical protein